MIEKVARAICLKRGGDPDAFHSEMGAGWKPWMNYENDAVAAIAAMREPTVAMLVAAKMDWQTPELPGKGQELQVKGVYRAMIDAALKEMK